MIEDFEERNLLLRKNLGYQLDNSMVVLPETEGKPTRNGSFLKQNQTKPSGSRPQSSRKIKIKKAPEEKFEFAEEK